MKKVLVVLLLPFVLYQASASNPDSNAIAKTGGQFLDNIFPQMANGNPLDGFIKATTDGVKNVLDGTTSMIGQVESSLTENNKFNETFNSVVDSVNSGIVDSIKQVLQPFNVSTSYVDDILKMKDDFISIIKDIVGDLITFMEDTLKQTLETVRSVIGLSANLLPGVTNDITKTLSNGVPSIQTFTCAQKAFSKLLHSAQPTGTHLSNCGIFHGSEVQKTFDMLKVALSFILNMEATETVTNLDKCHKNETGTTDPSECSDNVKTDFDNSVTQLNKTANYMKVSTPIQISSDLENLKHCYESVLQMFKDAGDDIKKELFDCLKS